MTGKLCIALAQFRPLKGNYRANLERLGEVFSQLPGVRPRPHVLHLPETSLSGYFVEGAAREVAVTAGSLAQDLDGAFSTSGSSQPLDVVLGFYERWQDTLYNSSAYVRLGEGDARILHVHRKAFLPTYGLFDEERFVERGHDIRAFDTPWGRAALLVCEDAWHGLSGTLAALDGAQLIFVSSAAPARGAYPHSDGSGPSTVGRWHRLMRGIAEEHGVFVSLANLVGSEGGKVLAGGSCVVGPAGDLRVRAPVFDEAVACVEIDLGDIGRARADTPLLSDLRTAMPHLRQALGSIEYGKRTAVGYDPPAVSRRRAGDPSGSAGEFLAGGKGERGGEREGEGAGIGGATVRGAPPGKKSSDETPDAHHHRIPAIIVSPPSDPKYAGGPPSLAIDAALVERWLIHFIQDEMRRRHLSTGIIGVSGGVDSAVTAFLAAKALGAENVLALRLPYRTSSAESLEHAQLVIEALRIPSRTIDISSAVDGFLAQTPDADATRRGNVMARVRMIALFDQSAAFGGIPLGTGNKTERLFGYFTWHADDSPPLNPLGDLFKTQVWALARHLGVPPEIVDKPASADLVVGQTDEGDFGIGYGKADEILNWLVSGFSAQDLIARGFRDDEVELVRRRLESTHWKRRLPTVAVISHSAIGESYLRPVDY